jgi:alkylation response protein AidB-like acyl-CoA dehydrogenase
VGGQGLRLRTPPQDRGCRRFDRAAYNELAELGLAGLYISEADGGMGMGPVEGMVVMEELGRGIVLEPLTQTLIAGGVLSGYAGDALKAEWLPRIASGEALVVLASQERKARYQLGVCEAKATRSSVGWCLSATKNMVPVGDQADAFIVPATVDGTIALFLVERNAAGVATVAMVRRTAPALATCNSTMHPPA